LTNPALVTSVIPHLFAFDVSAARTFPPSTISITTNPFHGLCAWFAELAKNKPSLSVVRMVTVIRKVPVLGPWFGNHAGGETLEAEFSGPNWK
jgi:hypothetical protein